MANHDKNFRDSSGPVWLLINAGALAWICMPAIIGWSHVVQAM
ncbi:hypothetical protein [Amphritea pacifica]|nr:hypothetical protein [Amphritea pacifica]